MVGKQLSLRPLPRESGSEAGNTNGAGRKAAATRALAANAGNTCTERSAVQCRYGGWTQKPPGWPFSRSLAVDSSGGWIRTNDLRVMSQKPESVLFVRRVLQTLAPAASAGVSQTGERWFLLARHVAIPKGTR